MLYVVLLLLSIPVFVAPSKDVNNSNYNERDGTIKLNRNFNIYELNQTATDDSLSDRSDNALQWLGALFIHNEWTINEFNITQDKCKQELNVYLTELRNGTLWALKISDASGRYSGQFFFGNEFWLGSSSLCRELQNSLTNDAIPPFPLTFHVARVQLLIHGLLEKPKAILLGQCLPSSCDSKDIRNILETRSIRQHDVSPGNSTENSLNILAVRAVPGSYRIWNDKKFFIVGGAGVTVVILIAIATIYETYLKLRKHNYALKDTEIQNNNEARNRSSKTGENGYQNLGVTSQIILSFSACTNGNKILDTTAVNKDSITCIHGLRFLSLAWIIMVHTYLQMFGVSENKFLRVITERNYMYQTVGNATFSVDTFFFISGFLVTVLYYRTLQSTCARPEVKQESTMTVIQKSIFKFFTLLVYRILRLTPAYLFVIGINELALRYAYNNSVFEPGIIDHITCDLYWWRNILYINNLYPQREMCMVWSWYMANDTQFYILGIALLLISMRYFKIAVSSLFVFLVSSWVTTAYISYSLRYEARIQEPFEMFDPLYDKPWSRIGPYFIGMMTGWLLHKNNYKLKLPIWVVLLGWVSSLTILWSLVYGMKDGKMNVAATAAYVSIGHTAWGVSLAWITIACCTGYGGFVNTLLSYRGILPLSRLTYCAYLVHPMIMMISSFQMDGTFHLHNGIVIIVYMGNCVASYLMSFAISLAFEAPIVRLLKLIFGGGKKNI